MDALLRTVNEKGGWLCMMSEGHCEELSLEKPVPSLDGLSPSPSRLSLSCHSLWAPAAEVTPLMWLRCSVLFFLWRDSSTPSIPLIQTMVAFQDHPFNISHPARAAGAAAHTWGRRPKQARHCLSCCHLSSLSPLPWRFRDSLVWL